MTARGARGGKSGIGFSVDRGPPAGGAGAGARGAGRAGAHRAGSGQYGNTPLHYAAIWGHVEVAEKLLAAGAAVGATDDVRAPRAGEGVAGGGCRQRFRAGCVLVSPFSLGGRRRIRGRERGPGAH